MFVAPRVRMFDSTGGLHALEMFAVAGPIAAENNHDAAVVIARTPKPVALMIANRFRQTEPRPKEIDRVSLAIAVGENRRARLFFARMRFVNTRGPFRHFAPAELVREIL